MKILVISLSGIGDTLIATPLIRELRDRYPNAVLEALVLWPGSKSLLEGNPHLHAVHQKNLIREGAWASLPFLLGLRRRRFDISINVHTQGRRHYRAVARFIGARLRLSHEYENHGWLDRLLVNRTVPQDYTQHSVVNNQRLLNLLAPATPLESPEYELYLAKEEIAWANDYSADLGLKDCFALGVHVGSGSTKNLSLKRWPLEHYQELFRRLTDTYPRLRILLLGGPEEKEAHAALAKAVPHDSILAAATPSLRHAAALMKHCHGFLSVDTALMHLAAAMKVPHQMVIEAPTLNATNLPWKNPFRVIRNPVVAGRNLDYYRYDGQPIKGTREELLRCMKSISVEDVYQAVDEAVPFNARS